MSYKDGYQKELFVLESFEDAEAKIRSLATIIRRIPPLPASWCMLSR